ncbi:MAG: aldehyde dehydrogenase family protein, partial [Spirochaetales bacterium]|nr:aldehyde dehydrogenase family protein [Spirochaetales bacterium]
MEINENAIRDIVSNILKDNSNGVPAGSNSFAIIPGVFDDMNKAIYEARKAHKIFSDTSLEIRRAMIKAMRQVVEDNAEQFARLAVEETGMGRFEDKIRKNQLAGRMTPGVEDLGPSSFSDDHGLTITERASYGVIGAIAPSTNPTETIINNSISMVSAGNTVVFNSHPGAKNVSVFAIKLLNEAILKAGGPANVVVTVKEPTIGSAKELMTHPMIDLLTVTGGPAVVGQAMQSTKKVIAAGPGNPPSVVDETANIEKAAKDLVAGTSFDNNIV